MADIELKHDCLIEILSRLPIKSLIPFTCVSKGWLSLIRSPEFATKHYSSRSKSHQSLLSLFKLGCSISLFSSQNQNYDSDTERPLTFETAFKFRPAVAYDPLRFQIYHRDIIKHISVMGPCNGLFLISLLKGHVDAYHVLLLWNPATREIFELLPLLDGNNNSVYCCSYGFGFDCVTDDYKVVGLCDWTDTGIDHSIVWLYSLATNSWRRLHHAYDHIQFDPQMGVRDMSSCNGRMYNWILDHGYGYLAQTRRDSLLSFDMVDEVFVETPLPPDVQIPNGFLNHGSNQPCVYSIGQNGSGLSLQTWVLLGYGPTGVWNKLRKVNLHDWLSTRNMVLWNSNEIVFSPDDGTLTWLNLTTKQMKSLGIPADDTVVTYTQSLVSIARYVRQPPIIDHSSVQINNTVSSLPLPYPLPLPLLPQEDDGDDSDDSASSTDSAFITPDITAFNDYHTVYINYEADAEFYPYRLNEVLRLSNLPYCLVEINRPMVSNPCTF